MKYIEIAFEKKELGEVLKKEFEGIRNIELIDRTKNLRINEVESLENYLPQPTPIGFTPDPLMLIKDFVLGIVVCGSYDLMKLGLKKGIVAIKRVAQKSHPEGIKIFTGSWIGTWFKHPACYDISYTLPYRVDEQSIEVLAGDVKQLDQALKKFLHKTEGKIKTRSYKFKYSEDGWELKTK